MPKRFDLQVASSQALTPHMRRVVLQGDALSKFPRDQESAHVKVAFCDGDEGKVLRSYTVRAFDADKRQITLDFVDHGDSGPASRWARTCQIGQSVTIFGPGERKLVDPDADWYLIGGDLSALPAIAANLEHLRPDAKGYVIIEIPDPEDRQELSVPDGIQLQWLVNDCPDKPNMPLVDAIRALSWLPGRAYPWFAGEFSGMRAMRSYLRGDRGISKKHMYLSSYWKHGDSDEQMKLAKKLDASRDALFGRFSESVQMLAAGMRR